MARSVLRYGRIGRCAEAGVAELRVGAGVRRIAIVGVNHMTRRAAAPAIIAGMIVRARKREDRIEQSSLLQAKKNGIRAKFRAKAAVAEFVVGLAGIFGAIGIADLSFLAAAAFENAQNISRL